MKHLRRFRSPLGWFMTLLVAFWQIASTAPLPAAILYWDTDGSTSLNNEDGTNLGGSGTWDTTTANWWNLAPLTVWPNTNVDHAIFAGTPGTVTVSPGILANRLTFRSSGYVFNGGTLTLAGATPTIHTNTATTATFNTQILGTDGLTKTGAGTVYLNNASNAYTGVTSITNGTLVIGSNSALGADTSTVMVTGAVNPGSLFLASTGYGTGFTLSRNLSISGGGGGGGAGAGAINGIALISHGNNTLAGTLSSTPAVGTTNTGLTSTFGLLTLGNVTIGGTPVSNYTTFGSANSQGSYRITGTLSGTGSIQKAGVGTLLLEPTNAAGFSGTIRVTSGSVRIASGAVLGANTGTTTNATLDMNGGTLEVRADGPTVAIGKNVNFSNNSTIFAGRGIGGTGMNGTVTFGALTFLDNVTVTFNGRNGYGMTFTSAQLTSTADGPTTFTNNLNGLLTIGGNLWNYTESDTARTFTMGGNGNTLVTGSVLASNNTHGISKTGTGTLTILGTGSTYTGTTAVSGNGALAITDFRSINNNTAVVNLGSTTTAGTLSIIGNDLTLANVTTSKVINLNGTTGGAIILANQTGTSPGLVFNANFTAAGAAGDVKTLTLGGLNTADNTINGIIPNNAAGGQVNVAKNDAGTWVLAGSNTYSGSTTVTNGILKLKASAGASDIIKEGANNTIVFGANATTQSAGGILEFIGVDGVATTETLGGLTMTAGMGTVRLVSGGGGAAANLIFNNLPATPGKTGGVNFDTTAGGGGTVTLTGVATSTATTLAGNGHFYINGADFARSNGGVLVAPVYGTDAGFVTAGAGAATLTAANHNLITGDITAQTAVAITSLKMTTHALTLTGDLTVNTGGVANDGGILVTGGNTASISGGGLTTGGAGTLVFRVDGINDVLTLNTPMLATTTGGFTKNGAGTLVLGGTNLQTGATTINEGTVRLTGGSTRLSGASQDLAVRQGATLDINGISTGTAIKALVGAGIITNGASPLAATLTIGNGNGGGIFSGIISDGTGGGVLSLTKVGTTAQTLSGLNTYSGVTTIGSTALVSVNTLANIGTASSIGRGNATSEATNAASLVFNGTTGGLNYTGTATISTDRLFTLNGSAANSGAQIANASALNAAIIFSNTGAIRFGTGATVAQTLILAGASTGDNQFNPQITDNGALKTGLTKNGVGMWILGNSNNTYTGNTIISDGILQAQDGTSLSSGSGLLLGVTTTSGTFQTTGNFTRNVSTVALAGANTVSWNGTTGGGGFAASEGKLVVALGGLATPTALTWGVGGFVGTGGTQTLVLNSTTALGEVEFRNAINLNGSTRTITVNDNTSTFTDFATITGVISGSGGISKAGGGLLQLMAANTYAGPTFVTGGTLVVTSLGNSGTPGSSTSIGTSTDANLLANALVLGNAGTTAGVLVYVGAGEVSDRYIQINTTTGSTQIIADGTGALVLTNVQNSASITGNKTLFLRGSSNFENMITNVLTNDSGGGTLAVTHDGPGTWILTGDNAYTGTTSANAGALGIGHNNAAGLGTLSISNGSVFAYGADRTLNNAITQSATSGTIATFFGDYSLFLNGAWIDPSTTSSGRIVRNNIVSGKVLQINGNYSATAGTTSTGVTFDGSGDTIINGIISTTMTNFGITYAGTGSLTLGGANSYTGATTLTNGRLILDSTDALDHEVIPDGAGKGNVVISPAAGVTATLDVNGSSETINGLTMNSAGNAVIDNTSNTTASLTFGANDAAVNIGTTGTGTYTITDTGAGALSIIKTGTGAAVIGLNAALTYQGTTSVTGGSMTIDAELNGSTGLSVTNPGSVLSLHGGITTPSAITSVTVGNGATLSLLDGVGNKLTSLTALSLGSPGGTSSTLNLNVGDALTTGDFLNTDTLTLLTGGALTLFSGNKIVFNLTDAGLRAGTTYNLVTSVDGGLILGDLTAGEWELGSTPGGFSSITLNTTDTGISITTGTLITGALYWTANGAADNWSDAANWSVDKSGAPASTNIPGQGTDVVFVADTVAGGAIVTTLEQNFRINSLTFEASTVPANTPSSVTINAGASPTSRLEIAPGSSAVGISIAAGGAPAVTIAAPLRIGANQTWNVTDEASLLTISGPLQGEADVTKTGAGRVLLSGVADSLFNAGQTTDFIVTAGSLEISNAGALGTALNNNLANVIVNGGAFFFNGAGSTTVNNITLGGGTLSAGGGNQTYSGAVTVSAASIVNMRDANSATSTTARNITLSGILSGAGKLTVDSVTTVSAGNQLGGTLTLSNNNSGWSGGIDLLRGTITATNVNALGTGDINASFGRIIFSTAGGTTFNLNQNITLDAPGGVLEIQADASGTPVSDMVVNFNGTLTLGGVNSNMALRLLPQTDNFSVININGPVVLGGNASISTAGSTTRGATIAGVISEQGGSFVLTINDDLGGWAQTNRDLNLTAANTYTGGTILSGGLVRLGNKASLGTGLLTIAAASSLAASTNLTGADRVMNAVQLNSTLTFSGNNSLELGGAITMGASRTINANGTAGAKLILSGPVSLITATANSTLTLAGTGEGVLSGGFTQSGTGGDLVVSTGSWTFTGGTIQPVDDLLINGGTVDVENVVMAIGDDIVVTGATAVLNLNSAGVWDAFDPAGTSSFLFVRTGAVVNLNSNDVNGVNNANATEGILLGDSGGGIGTLNTNTFSIVAPRFDLGAIAAGSEGNVIGSGSVISNYTGSDYAQGFRLFRGTISANLAGAAPILKQGFGDVTLSGDNSGLTGGTSAATRVDSGNLILDYSIHNTLKIPSNRALDMRGGTVTVKGNGSAATTLNVAGLTLANNGASNIAAVSNGFATTINLGAITRTTLANAGTIRFHLPVLGNITTTTTNTDGILGGWATVRDTSGEVNFAANDGANNIVAVATTAQDDMNLWAGGQHITDSSGFTGSRLMTAISSLRFNANAASNVTILSGGNLVISSGGILMTSNAATGGHSISGGVLSSANGELIFIQDSTAQSLTVSSSILTGGVTKAGAGTLILDGVNHYSGPTNIQAGTLRAVGGFAIGDSSVITFADDQVNVLDLEADEVVGSIAGGTTTAGLVSGTVDIGAHTLTLRNGASFNGTLSGTGTLVLDSVGTTNFNITGSTTTSFTGSVVVNNGLFILSGSGGRLNGATSFTINKGGAFLLDNNDNNAPNDRLSNSAAFTLHSADGVSGVTTPVRGLWIRTDNNNDETEAAGGLTLGSGASYFSGEATGGTSSISAFVVDNIIRSNNATLNARGTNLGLSTGTRSQLRIGTAANQTAFIGTGNNANLVGGGGLAGSKNISIVPWAIGENTTVALVDANMGNSLVTYVSGAGFRPLDFTTEYSTFASRGSATDHNVRESLTGDLTGLTSATVNALVLNNNNTASSTVNVLGTGAGGQVLSVTSGAMLFTLNSSATAGSAHQIVLGGFDGGITMGGAGITDEYVIHVVNPSSATGSATLTATISSNLTSTADITKAGRGTLILSGTNTAGGGTKKTTINEGVLQIADLANIGGDTGDLVFAGGTLRLGAGFADDISTRSITLLQGGGTVDTNGMDFVLANSIGGGGAGSFTKTGAGTLTFASSATYTGRTSVANGKLILGGGANNRLSTGAAVVVGGGTTSGVLQLGNGTGASDQTISELSSAGTGTGNAIVGGNAAVSTLTIDQDTVSTYGGNIGGLGANENNLSLVKTGVGILTLSGGVISYTGTTTVSSGVLSITGSSAATLSTSGVTVAGGAALYTINGAGQAVNLGAGTLNLGAGTGAAVLGMELGSTSAYDSYNTTAGAITANSIVLNLTGIAGFGVGTYDLLTASGGLNNATYSLGRLSGTMTGVSFNLIVDPTFVRLTTAATAAGDLYWRGAVSNSWMGIDGAFNTNFTTDLAGTINANATPGAANTVIFSSQGAPGTSINTTLDGHFTINDLRFIASPSGVTSVVIGVGDSPSSLTIAPSSSGVGIDVADNAGSITISAPLVLGANQTWNVVGTGANGSSLRVSGGITGSGSVEKTGAGIVTLLGTNTYTGATTITGGIWQAGATNSLSSASAHIVGAGGILRLNGFSNIIGGLSGSGLVDNNTATNVTLTLGGNNTSTIFSGGLQNGSTGTLSLTKTGTGTLTLSGSSSTMTGAVTVNGGIMAFTGTFNNGVGTTSVASAAATSGLLYIPSGGNYSTTTFNVGGNATGLGSLVINGGTVATTTANTATGIVSGNGGYGGFFMSGGSFSTRRFDSGTSLVASAVSVTQISGGTFTANEFILLRNARSEFTLTGGVVNHSGASQTIAVGELGTAATLTIAGGLLDNTGQTVQFGRVASSISFASLNLNGGTLLTNAISATVANITGAGAARVNFNGGTLKASAASTTFLPTGVTAAYVNGAFGTFTGGAVVDTNGFDITFAEPLLAPTGNGVSGLSLGSGGSGYIGAPYVEITGGGGTGATGYAVVDLDPASATFGQVIAVVLTNPGVDYTSAPTINLIGGGGTGAAVSASGILANVSGGLTKIGAGTLTLSGANTYTGGTTVNAGTLALGVSDALANTGAVTVNGGVFNVATFNDTVGTVTLQNGSITGTTGVLTGSSYELENGTVSAILGGTGNLNKTTGGTVTLSGNNTFSGSVNINGGVLAFSAAANLGDGSATNSVNVNGATLNYTGAGAVTLAATQVVNIGASGATVDVSSSTGALTVTGNVTGSAGGDLIKTGIGTLVLSGTNNLGAGGATNVVAGTLRAGFGTNGTSAITVSGVGTLELVNNAAQTLTLAGTTGALTLSGGATLGFELGSSGINDAIIVAAGGTAVVNGVITLNLFNLGTLGAGTYDLISVLGGGLNSATFVVGNAPAGFNYTINKTDVSLQLVASVLSNKYWNGFNQDGSWSSVIGGVGGTTNWSTDAAGDVLSPTGPGATDTVIFSAQNTPSTSISTQLDGSWIIDSLQFISSPTGVTDVTIAQGTGSGTLTISPATATNGIFVAANGGVIVIDAPVIAAAMQTWHVDGTGPNGSSLAVNGNTTFTGRVTKTGAGVLTLGGANSGAGGINLAGGTLNINSATAIGTGSFTIGAGTAIGNTSAGAVALSTNNTMLWEGNFSFTGTQALNLGTGAVTMAAAVTVTTTASTLTVGGVINDGANTFGLTKDGAGALTLSAANTFDGGMTLNAGTLNINNANAIGTGTFTINGGAIDNTTASPITLANNLMAWNASFAYTGTRALNLGNGSVTLGGNVTVTTTANTLTVGGVIDDGVNAFSVTKAGTGTLHLTNNSTYGGATVIQTGTVTVGVDNALPTGTALTVGSGTTAATLNLGAFSQTVASLTSNANAAAISNINIAAGETLTVNGNVVVGNNTDNATTNLTMSGGGALVVNGASFAVGQNTTGTNNSSVANLNLSGLSSFTATLTGALTVQLQGDNNAAHISTLTLSNTANTITAASVTVGGSATAGTQVLVLGAGTNVINANTINVGTGGRDAGSFSFGANATGSVVIRNTAGTGRAAFNMGTGGATTGVAATNIFNVSGHHADLFLGAVNIGTQNRGSALTNTFSFDQGTLDMTSLTMSTRTSNPTGTAARTTTSTMNLGGGIVNIQNGVLNLARAAGDYSANGPAPIMNATIDISGGTVTIGQTGGVAIRMAEYIATGGTGTGSANGAVNITGGTVTVNGDIIRVTNTSNATAVVTLNGGTAVLDMTGDDIGTAASFVTFNAQQGTLMNLGELNGGAGLTKTGLLTLILEGLNTYTGGTNINAGVLQVGSGSGTGNLGSGTVTTSNNTTVRFNRNNSYTVANTITGTGAVEQVGTGVTVLEGNNDYSGGTSISAGTLQVNSAGALGTVGEIKFAGTGGTLQHTVNNIVDYSARIANSTAAIRVDTNGQTVTYANTLAATNTGGLIKDGTGTLRLGAANAYVGGTTVNAGTLVANNTAALSTGDVTVNAAGTLSIGDGARVNATIGGSLVNTGTLQFDIFSRQAGTNPVANNDLVTLNSLDGLDTITLSGTLSVNDTTGTSATTWNVNDMWQLIDWAGFASSNIPAPSTSYGGFTTLDLPELNSGLTWNVITNTSGLYISVGIVPEPSRLLLLGLGFVLVTFRRRRK